MPELPEVETIARGLDKRVRGDLIESVWLGSKKELLKSPAARIAATLEGARIATVHRMGKHIVFELQRPRGDGVLFRPRRGKDRSQRKDPSPQIQPGFGRPAGRGRPSPRVSEERKAQWIVHLGMTGRMLVCPPDAELEKHTHAVVKLVSGREVRFVDPRRFGRLSVASNGDFEAGGIEPLEIPLEPFIALFRGRRTPIKSALLNQKLLRGVGNIYADESLYRAGIRPRRRASSLTRDEMKRLHASIRQVLREAIRAGGSSVSNYVDADGEEGFFQLRHRVYGREGAPCRECRSPIKRIVIAGRSSHYCPKCQR
jgi:formamidopyrimidine-DNA glycosylase